MDDSQPHRSSSFRSTTSLRDSADYDKFEGTGSWDSIEWTKIDPVSRSVSYENLDFFLESERVIAEGFGVVLVNTDEAGTVIVTNFRLLFLSEGTRNLVSLGTIPLATIEKFCKLVLKSPPVPRQIEKIPCHRLLQIIGKDLRIIVFNFRPRTKQRRAVFDALLRWTKPERLWDLYAFIAGPSKYANVDPKLRLLNEYCRLLGKSSHQVSLETIENGSFTLSNDKWRISNANLNYTLCPTYPFAFIAPKGFSDEDIMLASKFRARSRFPVVTWCHPETGAVLARSSQPLVGIMMNARSNADERLAAAFCAEDCSGLRRKLYIADARPRKNALANGAKGGGSESSSNYFQSEVVFFGIDNIHGMRESFVRLRDYLDTHGATSSDGVSSYLRNGGWTWGGGNLSSMSASVSTLGDSGWLNHIQSILAGSAWIAARIAMESSSVLVHCSDGWDRTSQLVALASLLLDPYYRTFKGFQALVEKDWLAYGHNFSDRCGTPTVSCSGNMPYELSRQSSAGSMNISSSTMRQSSVSFASQNYQGSSPSRSQTSNNNSPIFLQWVDCISQLMRMYPSAFEFSSTFLVDLLDCVLSCRFGNFLCNCDNERQHAGVSTECGCLWAYLTDIRSSDVGSHAHCNIFYDPMKHNGPLLPPAAALAPTLWPQFHLRWACPMEAQAGEIEGHCRSLAKYLSDVQKANEIAENKVNELTVIVESSATELEREKQLRTSAQNLAEKATKECDAIKRAIQSLGCQIHFSSNGDLSIDVEGISKNVQQGGTELPSRGETDVASEHSDNFNHSVSVSASMEDPIANNPLSRVCQSLCPLRNRDGGCRWPDAGCAQLGSQFVGFKANFDAFDQLSIYDKYFGSE